MSVLSLEGHNDSINGLELHEDGLQAISASSDCTIRLWDLRTGSTSHIFETRDPVKAFAISFPETAAFSQGPSIVLADHTGAVGSRLLASGDDIGALTFSPDGIMLASGTTAGHIQIWERSTSQLRWTLAEGDSIRSIVFSADGLHLVSSSEDDSIQVWDAQTGLPRILFEGHDDWVRAISISPNSKYVASGSDDRHVKIWSIDYGEVKWTSPRHEDWVTAVTFSSAGHRLTTGCQDASIRLFDVNAGKEQKRLFGHQGAVQRICISPHDKMVISSSEDLSIRVWDLRVPSTGSHLTPFVARCERPIFRAAVEKSKIKFEIRE